MIKVVLLLTAAFQGPGGPPAAPLCKDREPMMTASISPGAATVKQGAYKITTITTTDLDTYEVMNVATQKLENILLPRVPNIYRSLQSTTIAPGTGTITVTSSTNASGVTVLTHSNPVKSIGSLSQLLVIDTFDFIDEHIDTLSRDEPIQLQQQVIITKD